MKKSLWLLVLGLTACGANDTAVSNGTQQVALDTTTDTTPNTPTKTISDIRIATESNYKPFSYLDSLGNHEGFEIDLIHALCDKMQATCTISSQDWESLIPGLNANRYDAIFASMSATDERRKVVSFSDPYFNNKLVLVGKQGDTTTINDVDGKDVAAQQATVSANYLENHHPNANIRIYDKQVNAYLDLNSGRVQYLLSDIAPALDWLTTEQGAGFEIKGEPIDINDNVAIAMRQEDTQLATQFNTALAELKASGEYDAIVANYFDLNAIGSAK